MSLGFFQFPTKGPRSIAQIKSFWKNLGLSSSSLVNVNVYEDQILEVTTTRLHDDQVVGQLTKHLKSC